MPWTLSSDRDVRPAGGPPCAPCSPCGWGPWKRPPRPAAGQPAAPAAGAVKTVPGMPPVVDPANLYGETAAARLAPATAGALARVYVPNVKSNDVYVIDPATMKVVDHVQGRHQPAARGAVVGPQDPLGDQQRRGPEGREPHADRSDDGEAGQAHRRRRSLQHVLLARRAVGHRGGRGPQATRLPRSAHHEAPVLDRRAEVRAG